MISCSREMGGWSPLLKRGRWAVTTEAMLMGAGSQQKGAHVSSPAPTYRPVPWLLLTEPVRSQLAKETGVC